MYIYRWLPTKAYPLREDAHKQTQAPHTKTAPHANTCTAHKSMHHTLARYTNPSPPATTKMRVNDKPQHVYAKRGRNTHQQSCTPYTSANTSVGVLAPTMPPRDVIVAHACTQIHMDIAVMPKEVDPRHHTHMELSPMNMLSVVAQCTPFSDMNQSPRNMYQCQMGKQVLLSLSTLSPHLLSSSLRPLSLSSCSVSWSCPHI